MDDRKQFAALIWATQLGLIDKDQVTAAADRRITELECPDNWLVEVSLSGTSNELDYAITSHDDDVFLDILLRAYTAWSERRITNKQLVDACRALRLKAGYPSRWYDDFIGIESELDLVDQGVFRADEFDRYVKDTIEPIIGD